MSTGPLSGTDASARAAAEDAARRAAEEAARRAAEEAAKKAAEEAAKKAAEEAAKKLAASQDKVATTSAADSRLAAYAPGPDEPSGGGPADLFIAEHAATVSQLPVDQQEKLKAVVNNLCNPATQTDRLAERTFGDLGLLLDQGKLSQTDAKGKTILDHLAARLDQPVHADVADGLNRSQEHNALHEIVRTVAHPGAINQGEGTYTCTTAVVQQMLARTMPADYVGMATGLIFDGVAAAPTGTKIALDTAELYEREIGRKTGRGAVDAIFQGSLLAYAQKTFPAVGDEVEGGRFSRSFVFGGGRFSARATYGSLTAEGGLTSGQVGGLLEKVLGLKTQDIQISDTNREVAYGMFQTSLDKAQTGDVSLGASARGVSSGIPVGVQTQDGKFHEILVQDISDGKVSYIDPVDGKEHQIDEDDFKFNLRSIKVPAQAPSRFTLGGQTRDGEDIPTGGKSVLYAMLARTQKFGVARTALE